MKKQIKIAPSLLAADFSNLSEAIQKVERAGCDLLHIDVMDGHFVPNLTVGPVVVQAIRRITSLPLDVHLMIEQPAKYIESFKKSGADSLTVHAEACGKNLGKVIAAIRAHRLGCGVSLKPASSLKMIQGFLDRVDLVLLMTVNPGFGGQAFMPEVLPKIRSLRKIFKGNIEVDGGINDQTCRQVIEAGANILVAGTAIFGKKDVRRAIEELRCPR